MCLYVQLVQTKDKQCKKCNYITMLSSVFISLLFPTPVNSNYGTFAPWSELSLPGAGTFAPTGESSLELSLPGNESSRELSPPGSESLVMYNFVTFATWIQSRLWPAKSMTAFQSSVLTNNDVEGWHNRLNRQRPDTRRQAGPGSYPVQGGNVRYGPVCARVRRAFVLLSAPDVPRCAGPSAGVLASLQGQRTDHVAAARPSDGSSTALNRAEHLTIDDAV